MFPSHQSLLKTPDFLPFFFLPNLSCSWILEERLIKINIWFLTGKINKKHCHHTPKSIGKKRVFFSGKLQKRRRVTVNILKSKRYSECLLLGVYPSYSILNLFHQKNVVKSV